MAGTGAKVVQDHGTQGPEEGGTEHQEGGQVLEKSAGIFQPGSEQDEYPAQADEQSGPAAQGQAIAARPGGFDQANPQGSGGDQHGGDAAVDPFLRQVDEP